MGKTREPYSCTDCQWWAVSIDDSGKPTIGFCHRYPPINCIEDGTWLPIETDQDDWCGEFKSKTPTRAERFTDLTPVGMLELGVRVRNRLDIAGIETIGELISNLDLLKKARGFGASSLREVKRKLDYYREERAESNNK